MIDLKSHPFRKEDPWFPCKRGDWVLLGEGTCCKVVGITAELVQIIMRGGAVQTFATADFLARSPVNLSRNFRLTSTIGISYSLQADSVSAIPAQLLAHVAQRIEEEGFSPHLVNLKVEFERANSSSLDLMVLADFDGAAADHYAPLGRSLQRWCVEACTRYGWEIPFTQLTLHQAGGQTPAVAST
jgi:small-conductance mechanosensitive channel